MANIALYDVNGECVRSLTQWDHDVSLKIRGVKTNPVPEVRCSNKNSTLASRVSATIIDDCVVFEVPNELLQEWHPINILLFYSYKVGDSKTEYRITIPVSPSKKPDGYAYTPSEVKTLDNLIARVEDLEKSGVGDSDTGVSAGGEGGAGYVTSEEPPENTKALWVNTSEPEEAVALGVTAEETAEGVDLYCTDELGTTKVSLRHGRDSGENATLYIGPDEPTGDNRPLYWLDTSEDEVAVTLVGITATYSGGSVAVGTALSALTGITVTAEYSDGSRKAVTGYTLSGEIAEGSNTITVTYEGQTATFTVTGVAESVGEEEPDATTYSITNNLTNVSSSNAATSVEANASYTATLTAADGYALNTVTVTMGGTDITATAYADGVVSIAAVTGDVVITAAAVLTELPDISTFVLSEPWLTDVYSVQKHDPASKPGGAAIAAGTASDDAPLTDYFAGAYDTLYAVVFRPNAADGYGWAIGWSIKNKIIEYNSPAFSQIASLTVGMTGGAYVDGNRLRWMPLNRKDVLAALADTEYSSDDVRAITQNVPNVGAKNYNVKVAWMTSEPTAEQQQAIIAFFENGGEL